MAQTCSSDETLFNSEKEQIFRCLCMKKITIMQEAKSDVSDRNCKFHDIIPHIIQKNITLIKNYYFTFWNISK